MKVVVSLKAKEHLKDIKKYLVNKWGSKVFKDFLAKKKKVIDNIKSGIITHQQYEDTPFRKVLITEHNTMIYHIDNDTIYIVGILNNYKEPESNYKDVLE